MMWGYGMGWHVWGWVGMALFGLTLILIVVMLLKYLISGNAPPDSAQVDKKALDYLEETYAKGEISREEFLQKREDLKRS